MLKKGLRLGRKDLETFFRSKSRHFRGNIVTMRARRNSKSVNRFAFVVSGVKSRGAALRNLARRRMAEAVQKMGGAGWDIVFFVKLSERKVPSFDDLKKDVKYVISKSIL